jgi:hypothetical protein
MKRIALVVALLGVSVLAFAGTAIAAKDGQVKPFVWAQDPSEASLAFAEWTKEGLSLQKNAPTATVVMAGAEIKGVAGKQLQQLSFEVKDGTYCNPAPRFNVYSDSAPNGVYFAFGCIHGDKTPLGNGWTRVEFTGDEVGVDAGAFGATMSGIDIVLDEEGKSLLRNITVNKVVVK